MTLFYRHTPYYGRLGGLSIVLNAGSDTDNSASIRDVKMLIHSSNVYPSDLSVVKMLSDSSENIVEIEADVTKCSSDVKALSFDGRDCILPWEKRLR